MNKWARMGRSIFWLAFLLDSAVLLRIWLCRAFGSGDSTEQWCWLAFSLSTTLGKRRMLALPSWLMLVEADLLGRGTERWVYGSQLGFRLSGLVWRLRARGPSWLLSHQRAVSEVDDCLSFTKSVSSFSNTGQVALTLFSFWCEVMTVVGSHWVPTISFPNDAGVKIPLWKCQDSNKS